MARRAGTAVLLTMVGILLGFMLTIQMKTTNENNRAAPSPLRTDETARLLQSLSAVKQTNA
ncbi:MAG: hypothetical protein IRY98_11575, partial [Alicyclobacillaceae bacterium]|nr:hypothetical protein [Alicyclobacillaceae bacterium]